MQNSQNLRNEVHHDDLTSTFPFKVPLNSKLNLLQSSQQQVNHISIKLDQKSELSFDSSDREQSQLTIKWSDVPNLFRQG